MESDPPPSLPESPPAWPAASAPASGTHARAAHALADGVPQRLDPAYVHYERISGWVSAGVVGLLGPLGIGGYGLWSEPKPGRLFVLGAIWLALLLLLVATTLVLPRKRFERARWTVSRAGLEIRTGVVFRELTSVPRSRVQHLDVTQGPIQRRFGLATLVVHTAGQQHSEVELAGVTFDIATALRDDLMAAGAGDGA